MVGRPKLTEEEIKEREENYMIYEENKGPVGRPRKYESKEEYNLSQAHKQKLRHHQRSALRAVRKVEKYLNMIESVNKKNIILNEMIDLINKN